MNAIHTTPVGASKRARRPSASRQARRVPGGDPACALTMPPLSLMRFPAGAEKAGHSSSNHYPGSGAAGPGFFSEIGA